MATIDVLKLVFDSDASGMKRGTQEAKKGADDLKKSVLETDKAAQDMGDSFLSMVSDAKGSIASLVGFSTVTAGILNEAARVDQLGKFADTIGQNIEEIDAWGQVVARNGGTAEGFQGTLKGLTDSLTELQLTGAGPAADVLARFGISARDAGGGLKSAFDLLPEIADSFEGLSKAESLKFGQQLGLDQGTILTLQQGRFEVDQMVRRQKELGVATEEDAKIAREFNTAWQDTSQVFSSVFREIGVSVLPVLSDMLVGVQSFVQFMQDNEGLVEGIFSGMAVVLTAKLAPALLSTVFSPAGAAIALIALFALLYDDVKAFLSGNDSLIGQISEKYPIVGDIVKSLAGFVSDLFDNFGKLFDAIASGNLGKFVDDELIKFKKELNDLLGVDLSEFIDTAIDDLKKLPDYIKNTLIAELEALKATLKSVVSDLNPFADDEKPIQIQSMGGGHSQGDLPPIPPERDDRSDLPRFFQPQSTLENEQQEKIPPERDDRSDLPRFFQPQSTLENEKQEKIAASMNQAANNPLTSAAPNNLTTSNRTVNNHYTNNVGGMTVNSPNANPKEVAKEVSNEMNNQYRNTNSQYDDGVAI